MRFVLEIELGNDAMTSGRDVAGALAKVATELLREHDRLRTAVRVIHDENGNLVGFWEVRDGD